MPKNKKEKAGKKEVGGHKGAVEEQMLDEPSRVGSHTEKEAEMETRRYASITGDVTPPRNDVAEEADVSHIRTPHMTTDAQRQQNEAEEQRIVQEKV
jgi:hypothetical protein